MDPWYTFHFSVVDRWANYIAAAAAVVGDDGVHVGISQWVDETLQCTVNVDDEMHVLHASAQRSQLPLNDTTAAPAAAVIN